MANAKANATAVKTQVEAAGIPWDKLSDLIKNMNWLQLMAFIKQIISLFSAKAPVMKGAAGGEGDLADCCIAHQDAIIDLAECCKKCCGG